MRKKRLGKVRWVRLRSKRIRGHIRAKGMLSVTLWIVLAVTASVRAGQAPPSSLTDSSSTPSTRYGLFGMLDHRSDCGQGIFPEPFLVDDSDLEKNEARIDWLHTHRNDQHSDEVTAEVEKGFGLLTLELEIPFERDVEGQNV